MRIGTVSQLTLFPLKSARGVQLQEALCSPIGLKTKDGEFSDRRVNLLYCSFILHAISAAVSNDVICTMTSRFIVLFKFPYSYPLPIISVQNDRAFHSDNKSCLKCFFAFVFVAMGAGGGGVFAI